MSSRSLVASEAGIILAQQALNRLNLNRRTFSTEVGLSPSTVSHFFTKKPVDRTTFTEICTFLGLDWQDIAKPYSEAKEDVPELSPLDQVWQQIKTFGSYTEKMGLVLAKEGTLGWSRHNSKYEKSVRLGSQTHFEVNFDTQGYLLLIQKDTLGQAYCFCPSMFAPRPQLEAGKTIFPQEGSPRTSLEIEGKPGKEQILAVLTQDIPLLEWLPPEDSAPIELNQNHLSQLLDYIKQCQNCQILYTEYNIIE